MQAPYYSYFNVENFKDHTVFWKLDRVVTAMIEYLYSPIYQKVVRFHKLEKEILSFKNERYPMFMQKINAGKKSELEVKKRNKVSLTIQKEILKTREKTQLALEQAGLSINQIFNSKNSNQQNEL